MSGKQKLLREDKKYLREAIKQIVTEQPVKSSDILLSLGDKSNGYTAHELTTYIKNNMQNDIKVLKGLNGRIYFQKKKKDEEIFAEKVQQLLKLESELREHIEKEILQLEQMQVRGFIFINGLEKGKGLWFNERQNAYYNELTKNIPPSMP